MRWPAKDHLEWRRWFAWLPVKIGGQMVWFETIERRFCGECYEVRLPAPDDESRAHEAARVRHEYKGY